MLLALAGMGIGAYMAYQGSLEEEKKARKAKERLEVERAAQRKLVDKEIAIGERQRALEAKAINNESKNAAIETFQAQSKAEADAGSGMVSTAGSSLGISLQQRFEQANANLSQSINAATTNLDISGDQQQLLYARGQLQDTGYANQIADTKDAINSITDPLNRITQTALGAYSGGQMGYSLDQGLGLLMQEPAVGKIGDFFNKATFDLRNKPTARTAFGMNPSSLGEYNMSQWGNVNPYNGPDYSSLSRR
jgi:hypothetical protein